MSPELNSTNFNRKIAAVVMTNFILTQIFFAKQDHSGLAIELLLNSNHALHISRIEPKVTWLPIEHGKGNTPVSPTLVLVILTNHQRSGAPGAL